MKFLAITQPTATWLLSNTELQGTVGRLLREISSEDSLRRSVFVAGPLRIASTNDGRCTAVWNVDYLSSTGTENWGFLKLEGRHGALDAGRQEEMFRSAIIVYDARLQNLLLPGEHKVRTQGDGMATAVMGTGRAKRQSSLGYLELQNSTNRAVFVLGPEDEDGNLDRSIAHLLESLHHIAGFAEGFLQAANDLPLKARSRPAVEPAPLQELRDALGSPRKPDDTAIQSAELKEVYDQPLLPLTYEKWVSEGSPLGIEKRRILEANIIETQPLRIVGPAGSGKSLLMQLMAVQAGKRAAEKGGARRILYLVHNSSMMHSTTNRIDVLWPKSSRPSDVTIETTTLQTYCQSRLGIETGSLMDEDASETKSFQQAVVADSLRSSLAELDESARSWHEYPLLHQVASKTDLFDALVRLTVHEIGIVIKGFRLADDRRRYVQAERRFSRFHAILSPAEREVIFRAFEDYHQQVFEDGGFLDSDDLAISMFSQLRTPVWQLRRRAEGYDYLFVDETQLYNENERRLFPLLTRASHGNLPIAIAIDEAQSIENSASAGFGVMGLPSIRNETLHSVYRSTRAILRLAFHLIQRTTDLFGPEFPEYTALSRSVISDESPKASPPTLSRAPGGVTAAKWAGNLAARLRKQDFRQVCIIAMSDGLIPKIAGSLRDSGIEPVLIQHRGQSFDVRRPFVAVSTSRLVGGQEFDGVVIVGVEAGVFPARVSNEPLAAALEQEALRALYLSFTRARFQAHVALERGAQVTRLLDSALSEGLLLEESDE